MVLVLKTNEEASKTPVLDVDKCSAQHVTQVKK